jgi:phenylacetate-CoA ligase
MKAGLSRFLSGHLLDRKEGHRTHVLASFRLHKEFDVMPDDKRLHRQDLLLAKLLDHARQHVPFYREILKGEGAIERSRVRDVWQRLPIIQRSDIQRNPEGFLSDTGTSRKDDYTGGSTGTPMQFKVDQETQIARESSLMWADSLAGWYPGEKIAMLWGSDRDTKNALKSWRLHARWWLENRRWYDAFNMGPDELMKYHLALNSFRPDILVAYAGAVHTMALFLKQRDLRPEYPRKAIISSAEMLAPGMRRDIQEIFNVSVFDRYGNREAGAMAAECAFHQGLHVNENDLIVEIAGSDPTQTPGSVLITYLHNYAMPLIRYDTGDLGCWMEDEPCSCGRRTARLARIAGRQSDVIRTSHGGLIHGEFFTHLLYGIKGVREFQFVQEAPEEYCLRLCADAGLCRSLESRWREAIIAKVGQQASVRIEYVASIPSSSSGKRRFTFSLLKQDVQKPNVDIQ